MSVSEGESWLERLDRVGRLIEDVLLVAGVAALILLAVGQILLRNVFSVGIAWGDPLIRLLVLWLTLVGAVAAARDHKHIAIDAADRLLGPRVRRAVAVVRYLFTSAICAGLAWYSLAFVRDAREFGDTLLGNLPAWWFQLILPVAFALLAYRYLLRTAVSLRARH